MNIQRKTLILLIIFLLLLASLSCNLVKLSTGEDEGDGELKSIPASTEAVEDLKEGVQSAIATAQSGGPIQLVITEAQLTSLAVMRLQAPAESSIEDIQVHLRDGQIRISGTVEQNGVDLPLNISLEVFVEPTGLLHSEVITATVGPFPLPESVLDQITAQLDQALMTQFKAGDLVVDSVTIAEGTMTILGHVR